VLYALYFVSFVSRAEVQKWPVLNLLVKCSGTIFIDRSKKREILKINKTASERLMNNGAIGFFPEGKTSDGKGVLPFKAPLLQAAIIAKSKILPLVLKYYTRSTTKPAYEITYAGDITLWQTIKSTLLLNGIRVKIIALPQFYATDFTDRHKIAQALHKEISTVYNKGY
nr:1-acyl-sn-glycerol-3-phosphate acyltransferase [Rickettsiaceae bacterium]